MLNPDKGTGEAQTYLWITSLIFSLKRYKVGSKMPLIQSEGTYEISPVFLAFQHNNHSILDYVAKLAIRLFLVRRKINSDKLIYGDGN